MFHLFQALRRGFKKLFPSSPSVPKILKNPHFPRPYPVFFLGTNGTLEQNLFIKHLQVPTARNSGTNIDSILNTIKLYDT